MKLEHGRISGQELMFAVFCFMQGTMLRSGFIIGITKNDSWAMAFTGLLIALPIALIYAALMKGFPQKSLIEINDVIFGPVIGKVFSVLYLFFFVSLAALNTRDLGSFVIGYMLPETPIPAIHIFFLLVCAYTIYKGLESLFRLSVLFSLITLGTVFINFLLVLKDMSFAFLQPFFRLPLMAYVQGTLSVAAVPMGELLAFMMVAPILRKSERPIKPIALGLTVSAVFLAVVTLRDIMTLGPLLSIVSLATFESVRYVSVGGFLTRMESLYAIVLVILFIFKVVVLLYAFILGLSQLLGFKSYVTLTLISTALVFLYSIFVFESIMNNMNWGATAAPFFSLTFEFALPLFSLLVARLRGLMKKPRETA